MPFREEGPPSQFTWREPTLNKDRVLKPQRDQHDTTNKEVRTINNDKTYLNGYKQRLLVLSLT